jgi:hypothetical protein
LAIKGSHYYFAQELILAGADLNIPDAAGFTPVHLLLCQKEEGEQGTGTTN